MMRKTDVSLANIKLRYLMGPIWKKNASNDHHNSNSKKKKSRYILYISNWLPVDWLLLHSLLDADLLFLFIAEKRSKKHLIFCNYPLELWFLQNVVVEIGEYMSATDMYGWSNRQLLTLLSCFSVARYRRH